MRVRFVFPHWERFLTGRPELADLPYARRLDAFRVTPLNIPTVAALTPEGIDVDLVDDFTEAPDLDDRPDLVAITAFTPQAARAYEIADAFRSRGVPVVLGGLHPSVRHEEALGHADAVVAGEAEGVWPDLLADLGRGELKRLYRREGPAELGGLPAPRRDLFHAKGLTQIGVVQTGRGCPRRCPTCVVPAALGSTQRRRPVEDVLEEIRNLVEPTFYISEETVLFSGGADRAWTDALLEGLQDVDKTFFIATYPFLLRGVESDFLRRLEKAGNRQFYVVFGVDEEGPDALWRSLDEVKRALDAVRECGISVMGSFVIGGDEDGPETFERVLDLGRELRINLAEFTLLTPFPGTPFHEQLEAEGRILSHDWKRYNGAHVVFRPKRMTPDQLTEGFIALWRAFYGDMTEYSSTLRFVRGFGSDLVRRPGEGPAEP
jgi:radical SAM superfamily enzyme YgiQ (UPF0313 family)